MAQHDTPITTSAQARAAAVFAQVHQAWAVLRDGSARRDYDRRHGRGEQPEIIYRSGSGDGSGDGSDDGSAGGSSVDGRPARSRQQRRPVAGRRRQNKVQQAGGEWWGRADDEGMQVNPAGPWWVEALKMELALAKELKVCIAHAHCRRCNRCSLPRSQLMPSLFRPTQLDVTELVRRYQPDR